MAVSVSQLQKDGRAQKFLLCSNSDWDVGWFYSVANQTPQQSIPARRINIANAKARFGI
jgi:hypothetical protein